MARSVGSKVDTMSIVEEIQAGLTERKGKKVNVRRLKVGDTISLPVFPDGKRKMIDFKVTRIGPHAAGGFNVKASSVKPGLADTSRVFSATDHVTLIEGIEEETLVEELKAESAMNESAEKNQKHAAKQSAKHAALKIAGFQNDMADLILRLKKGGEHNLAGRALKMMKVARKTAMDVENFVLDVDTWADE